MKLAVKVLVTTYPEAYLEKGGGEHEIHEITNALRQLSVVADLYGPESKPLKYYDTILHFSLKESGRPLLQIAKAAGKRVVLWPNIWLRGEDPCADYQSLQSQIELADYVVFRSHSEAQNLLQCVQIPTGKTAFVRTGIQAFFGEPADRDLFRTTYGVKDYILWLGLIEPVKNQLTAIKALRDISIPVLFVGGYRDKAYYDECIKAAPAHFRFLPAIPPRSELLRSALQNCAVYLETPLEPAGLSAIEAGLGGASLILSDDPWTREHFGDQVETVDPLDPASIRKSVDRLLEDRNTAKCQAWVRERYLLPEAIKELIPILRG